MRQSALGRNDPEHAQFVVEELMMVLGVVACVPQQRSEGMSTVGLPGNAVELQIVGLGAAIDENAEEQVTAGVDDGRQLGETMVRPSAALAEVRRGGRGLQAGGIDGRQRAVGVDRPPRRATAMVASRRRAEPPVSGAVLRRSRASSNGAPAEGCDVAKEL